MYIYSLDLQWYPLDYYVFDLQTPNINQYFFLPDNVKATDWMWPPRTPCLVRLCSLGFPHTYTTLAFHPSLMFLFYPKDLSNIPSSEVCW
jgi:hypothetical protein